jgi:hypothetical protein
MVDLGFLLISFFLFTTTLAKPKAMHLVIPDDSNIKNPSIALESKTLNLLLGANNNVFYYEGDSLNQIKNIGVKATGLRDVIISKKNKIAKLFWQRYKPHRSHQTNKRCNLCQCCKCP